MTDTDWNKPRLLELSGSYWQTCTLHTGVKLAVFSEIGNSTLSAEDMAIRLGADVRGMETLLNALCAMGLLAKNDEAYSNTGFSAKYLVKDSPDYTGFIIMHHHHLVDSWNRMSESVISGNPCRGRSASSSDTERESFLMGMFNIAMGLAPSFAQEIDLKEKRRFLDFGGGPGTYAIQFCLANPAMNATVFDLPTTRVFAERTIDRFGLKDRIDFKEGSYLDMSVPLERIYDVAWTSHNLHGEGPEDAERIVAHAVSAVKPGGLVMIHEFILNNDKTGPLFPALFSINMLVGTDNGRAYSELELTAMLERSGVRDIHRLPLTAALTSGVLCGRVTE